MTLDEQILININNAQKTPSQSFNYGDDDSTMVWAEGQLTAPTGYVFRFMLIDGDFYYYKVAK